MSRPATQPFQAGCDAGRASAISGSDRPAALGGALALLLLVGIAVAPQAPTAITSAITEGTALVHFNWKLDVVQPPLVSPADHCSSGSPCWLSTSAALTMANAPKSSEWQKLLNFVCREGRIGRLP